MARILTDAVSRSLEITEKEADRFIEEQASIGREMLTDEECRIEDIEDLMYEMGVEPDYLEEFLMRMI